MPHSANNSTSTQTKMSRPSSTSTYSGNVFPKQAGATLLAPEQGTEDVHSPAPSQFSFASSPQEAEDDNVRQYRQNSRSTLGDRVGSLRPRTSRSRQQFYEDSFSYKDGTASSARERVTKDAPIIAELRTNVIVCVLAPSYCSTFPTMLTKRRSKTSIPWSQTSRTTCQPAIRGPNHPS